MSRFGIRTRLRRSLTAHDQPIPGPLLDLPDRALRQHLRRVFAKAGVNCVIDAGARHGEYGLLLRHNGYRGRIISFEPVARSYARLSERAVRDPNWVAVNAALGSEDGTAEINVTADSYLASFLQPSAFGQQEFGSLGGTTIESVETVTVQRLDTAWPTVAVEDARVYLKMDTQGWDLEVLAGASGMLAHVVAVQSEVAVQPIYDGQETTYTTMIERLAGLGFGLSGLYPVSHDRDLRVVEFDCIAIRR